MTSTHSELSVPQPKLRREWGKGLKSLFKFITTPGDLGNSFEAMFALAGPSLEKEFEKFAQHPVGQRILEESPRRDLNAVLSDRKTLAVMPEDSFAHAYLDYLGGEEMGSADYFLEAADFDNKAIRFGWSDDLLWFVKRMANSHDLFHVLTGYDRTITGEVGIVCYTAGQFPMLPLRMLLVYFSALKWSQPIQWFRFVRDAYRHGRDTPPLTCVDYESLLSRPLAEVRHEVGVQLIEEAHPNQIPEKGWLLEQIERRVSLV